MSYPAVPCFMHQGWSQESAQQLHQLCAAHKLDLPTLIKEEEGRLLAAAQSRVRAVAIQCRLDSLNYIHLEDVHGPQGPGSELQLISRGGYGTVYRGNWQGDVVAVKKIEAATDPQAQAELAREAYIMSSCKHPNIAEIYGLAREQGSGTVCIIMRHYANESLACVLRRNVEAPFLTMTQKLQMALDIARGMAYLHERPHEMVVHGDLKPGNVLMDENLRCYISDFGMSSVQTNTQTIAPTSNAQSMPYCAPELLQAHQQAQAALTRAPPARVKRTVDSDMYAFGMTLYELFTGQAPFAGIAGHHIAWMVITGKRPALALCPATSLEAKKAAAGGSGDGGAIRIPGPLVRVIESCWQQEPYLRPSFAQVVMTLEMAAYALGLQVESGSAWRAACQGVGV